jgi:predicted amidophosphoribosyltransferase
MVLASCENCGKALAEDDLFCPKCGTRTERGRREKVDFPWEERLEEVRLEIDKAVNAALKEIHKGLKTASEEIERATRGETVTCSSCKERSPADARFCWACGKRL